MLCRARFVRCGYGVCSNCKVRYFQVTPIPLQFLSNSSSLLFPSSFILFPPLPSSRKNAATEKVALVGAAFSVANYWNLLDNLAE